MFKKHVLLISVIAALFVGCSDNKSAKEEKSAAQINDMVAKKEYRLSGIDQKEYVIKKDGNGFVLVGAEGKILILDIFATWCPPCRAAAKHLSSLQEKYKNELVIIGITIEDDIDNSKLLEFAQTYNASYTLVNSNQNRRLANEVVKELELGERFPIPTMAMYKDAKLVNFYVGATEEEFIESDIKNTLGK